ncbi:hypothetical protein WJX74_006249 [Apatococcus lobatus]|uniref:Protein kinase domain-containing protein n=1 Tax=Apatococcus lobatus TaxID=904363 RepID=A0AAW1RM79_9CHLO
MGCFSSKEQEAPTKQAAAAHRVSAAPPRPVQQAQASAAPRQVAQPQPQAQQAPPAPAPAAQKALVTPKPAPSVSQPKSQQTPATPQSPTSPLELNSPTTSITDPDAAPLLVNGVLKDPIAGHARWKTLDMLGMGAFGSVWLCENRSTGARFAVKVLERGINVKYVRREVINHSKIHCHQVIEFKEVFLTKEYLCLVLELAPGGDLLSYINDHQSGLQEPEARWIFQQLVIGVHHCHECGVVNRDLKPENCLVLQQENRPQKPLVKICDFGYSKQMDASSLMASKVGTPGYIAPEVMQNAEDTEYGPAADIWSLGVLLYVLLFRAYPFLDASEAANANAQGQFMVILKRIVDSKYSFPPNVRVSDEAKRLIQRMLVVDPKERITIAQICEDPWFKAGLPQRAFAVPYKTGQRRKGLQTEPEIEKILSQAQRRALPA